SRHRRRGRGRFRLRLRGTRVLAYDVTHRERHREQERDDEETTQQLLVADDQLEFSGFVISHSSAIPLRHQSLAALSRAPFNDAIISSGKGKTMVVFFSVPISTRVCKYRSCNAAGCFWITS